MKITVMLEQIEGDRYQATAMLPTPLTVEAATREDALSEIDAKIRERLSKVELIEIAIPTPSETNPWMAIAGTWKDHPDLDEVTENIRAYREELDADPDRI